MKKLIALLLALIVAFSCLVGCAAKEEAKAPAAEAPAAKEEAPKEDKKEEPAKESYPVVTWYLLSSESNTRDQEAVQAAANEIFREKLGLEVQLYFMDGTNFAEKMNVMMNAGEEMDIMAGGACTGIAFETAFRTGSLLPLDDLLAEYGPDIMAKSDERGFDSVKRDGKIYAIPSNMPWANGRVISWKKDLVEKYDIDIDSIKSMEDLEPVLAMIKENEPDIYPFYNVNLPSGNLVNTFVKADLVGKGTPVYEDLVFFNYDSQKMEAWIDQDCVVNDLRMANKFYQAGYGPSDALARTDGATEYKSGKYFAFSITSEFSGGSKSTGLTGYDCLESLLNYAEIDTASMNLVCTYISATSKQPENAMKVINLVWSDPALLNLLAYGIEGVNYTVEGTDKNGNPSVLPKSGEEQRWAVFHNYWGPLWDQWDSPWNSVESLEAMQDANKNSPVSQIVGFSFDEEPVKNQMAEVLAINTEISAVLKTGVMEDFDAYMAEARERLFAAGLQDVLDEAQRQYEEWLTVK